MNETPLSPDLLFSLAGPDWLKQHRRHIAGRTHNDYQVILKTLMPHFGGMRLNEINVTHLRAFQESRSERAGNARINIEISVIQQILREADLWEPIKKHYRPLPKDNRGSGQALSREDEEALLSFALSRRRKLVAHCVRLMFKTGCGFGEIRHLLRKNVDLEHATITINPQGAKNVYRERTVPLIPEALDSMKWIIERWAKTGGSQPDQYILPFQPRCNLGSTDFYRPMRTIKQAWKALKKDVNNVNPALYERIKSLRLYDARITAITRTLSDGRTSLHAAQRLFGHVSREIEKRYYKPDADMLRKAMDPLIGDAQPSPPAPQPTAAFVAAEKVDAKLTQIASGFNPMALIKKLQSLGMDPKTILDVVMASGEQ